MRETDPSDTPRAPDAPPARPAAPLSRTLWIALVVGICAAVVRIVYIFFPAFNVADVLVFGVAAAVLARIAPRRWFVSALVLVLPAMAIVIPTLVGLGTRNLQRGVGVGHFFSAILIPFAAFVGAWLGSKAPRVRARAGR